MQKEWESVSDTFDRIQLIWGIHVAKWLIALKLHDGKIRAKSSKILHYIDAGPMRYTHENSEFIRKLSEYTPQKSLNPIKYDASVGPGMWRMSVDYEKDVGRWDWWSGHFVITSSLDPLPERYEMSEILFRSRDVADPSKFRIYLEEAKKLVVRHEQPASVFRKWDWEGALAELIAIADHDGLASMGDYSLKYDKADIGRISRWLDEYFRLRNNDVSPAQTDLEAVAQKVISALKKK